MKPLLSLFLSLTFICFPSCSGDSPSKSGDGDGPKAPADGGDTKALALRTRDREFSIGDPPSGYREIKTALSTAVSNLKVNISAQTLPVGEGKDPRELAKSIANVPPDQDLETRQSGGNEVWVWKDKVWRAFPEGPLVLLKITAVQGGDVTEFMDDAVQIAGSLKLVE